MTLPSPLTSATVQQWADDLPYANKGMVAEQTFKLICQIEDTDLTPTQSIKVIEAADYPIAAVLDQVRSRLASGHGHCERFLTLGESICSKLVAELEPIASAGSDGLRILGPGRQARRAAQLASHYLEQWLVMRAVDHRSAPPALWQQAKALHRQLGRHHGGALPRMVAFQLSNPYSMNGREILDLATLLDSLPIKKLISIEATSAATSSHGFFLPEGDCGPEFGALPAGSAPIQLERLVAEIDTKRPLGFDGGFIRSLNKRWGGNQLQKSQRTATTRPIKTTAVIGIGGIVRHLSDLNPTFGMPPAEAASNTGFGQASSQFNEQSDTTEVSFMDISDGGCRIQTSWAAVQTGDIIAVFWGRVEWRLGSIVWMAKNEAGLECGVQWLLKKPEPISLRFDDGEVVRAISGRCLLDGQTGVLYNARPGYHGGHCLLEEQFQTTPVELSVTKNTGMVELARALPVSVEDIVEEEETVFPAFSDPSPEDNLWDSLTPGNRTLSYS